MMNYMKTITKYEKEVCSNFGNLVIRYGIIPGNNKIFFIKVGQDGSLYGYHDKYIKIAKNINEKYGCTVIVSSNPFNGINSLDDAMNVIDKISNELNFNDYEIYYFGHSSGALVGAWFGYMYPRIKRMVLVNGPLMRNYHLTKKGILNFKGNRITFVYGEYDPSIRYTELLNIMLSDKIKLEIIQKEDHHFSKSFDDFLQLPDKYLFYDFKIKKEP